MSKVTIEITKDNKTVIEYDNGEIIYPICEVTETNFNISNVTDKIILNLISDVLFNVGTSLRYQLSKQGFVFNALNKPTNGK